MSSYVAFLRAINVGGVKLYMEELRSICEEAGLQNVRTYIQSGNVLFESPKSENSLITSLEKLLADRKGREIPVLIRSSGELQGILKDNPYPDARPSQVGVLLLPADLPASAFEGIQIPGREEIAGSGRQVYIHYPDGMGRSKLKLPKAMAGGTMRNINTLTKLAHLITS